MGPTSQASVLACLWLAELFSSLLQIPRVSGALRLPVRVLRIAEDRRSDTASLERFQNRFRGTRVQVQKTPHG
jgi:hypothetical protein